MLYIIDAVTMLEIGQAYVPITIPFGFHNRFFSRTDLGISNVLKKHDINTLLPLSKIHLTPKFYKFNSNQSDARRQEFQPNIWRSRNEPENFWSQIRSKTMTSTATTTTTITTCNIFNIKSIKNY